MSKLRDHLLDRGTVVAISRETLRRILRAGGVSWQSTSTWKSSTDRDFPARMHRVLDLYDHPPDDGRVICMDEFGPLNLTPRKGKAWRRVGSPRRLRATYHRHPDVLNWAADHDVESVFLPTYSSWLNWIESEFTALRYSALNGTDHRTHAEQNAAIAAYVRWRNARARPKTGFATDSPIRTWTHYPAKVA